MSSQAPTEEEPPESKHSSRFGFKAPGSIALRSRDFRLFWSGYLTEVSGQQMLWVAQGWLIYELSGSAVLLGAAGLARAIPGTVLSLFGGALADKVDQRRLLIAVQAVQVALLAAMGTLTITGNIEVWHLLVILSGSAAAQSFENPARQAIFPRLVPREALMDAVALNSVIHPGSRFFGPVLGGLLMAQVRSWSGDPLLGAATLFYITALGYVVNACFLYFIHLDAVERRGKPTSVLQDMRDGIKVVFSNPIFGALILMTYCSHMFGWSFQSLFPVFAKDVFGGGEVQLGLMYSTLGAGSFLGAMTASNLGSVRRRGYLVIGGFLVQACLLLVFAMAPAYGLALGVLVLIGLSQSIFNVSAQSTLQYLVENEFRGRVMGIWGMTYSAVQPLGQLQMGAIAAATSAPVAVTIGAIVMIAFTIAVVFPNRRLRRLTLDPDAEGAEHRMAAGRH